MNSITLVSPAIFCIEGENCVLLSDAAKILGCSLSEVRHYYRERLGPFYWWNSRGEKKIGMFPPNFSGEAYLPRTMFSHMEVIRGVRGAARKSRRDEGFIEL